MRLSVGGGCACLCLHMHVEAPGLRQESPTIALPQSSLRQSNPVLTWPACSGDSLALPSEARIRAGPLGPPGIYLHGFMGDPNCDSHTVTTTT